jgi:hypothetical protein
MGGGNGFSYETASDPKPGKSLSLQVDWPRDYKAEKHGEIWGKSQDGFM